MNWLRYLLEANIYLAAFYLLYYILLANETHYRLNRIYLLVTCIIAYIIPFFQLGFLKPAIDDATVATIIINPIAKAGVVKSIEFNWHDLLVYGYIGGAAVTLVIFSVKIARLLCMMRAEKHPLDNKYKLIRLENSNTAFSFFNYVFIGTNVSGAETVIRHELVHIDQKHSADIIFLELVKVAGWFNPFIYLLQRSLKSIHEYIADEQAAAFENDTLAYSSLLVSNAYGLGGSSITHSFFNYNLLKKRIIMLNQKRSGNLARLKYLAALPVCAVLLCASTLGFSKTYGVIDIAPQKQTDTTKKLKIVEVKQPSERPVEIRQKINQGVKEVVTKQKKLDLKQGQSPDKVQEIEIVPVKDPGKSADLIKKLPGVKIADNGDVYAQGKPVTKIKINGKEVKSADVIEKPAPTVLQLQKIPPPMEPIPPVSKEFDALFKSMSKTIRYPAAARESSLVGSVIVKFDVDADKKITDINIIKGIGGGCDEEVVRAVKAFVGSVDAKVGNYKMAVTFDLDNVEPPKSASGEFAKDPSFAGEVIVVGYGIKK